MVKAAKTAKKSIQTGWDLSSFAAVLGLDQRTETTSSPESIYLAKADIDTATGGLVHLDTTAQRDKRSGAPLRTEMMFSTQSLEGNLVRKKLFEVQMRKEKDANGKNIAMPDQVYCMGHKIYDAAKDGPDFNIQSINNVWQAINELNNMQRPPFMYDNDAYSPKRVLQVLLKNNIDQAVGQNIESWFEGITAKGEFDFELATGFNRRAANDNGSPYNFPNLDFARAVIGDPFVNTLDFSTQVGTIKPTFATHTPSGQAYMATAAAKRTKLHFKSSAALTPSGPSIEGEDPMGLPDLAAASFRAVDPKDVDGKQKLVSLTNFGEKITDDKLTAAKVMKVMNRFRAQMASGIYPKVLRDLVDANIHERAYTIQPPKEGTARIDMMRQQGNDTEERIAGMGKMLGDATRFTHSRKKGGKVHKQGVLFELGASFAPKGSEYALGVPDITDMLEITDDLFVTHQHIDHVGGIGPYVGFEMFASQEFYDSIQGEKLRGKTIHAEPKVRKRLESEWTRRGVKKDLWPKFHDLKGHGFAHIRNKKTGELCFSVEYSAGTTNHSARGTPFKIYLRDQNKLQACILKPGDYRFGRHLVDGHTGQVPIGKIIDEDFLMNGPQGILAEEQRMLEAGEITENEMLDPASVEGRGVILEVDGTNYKMPGYAPTEYEAECSQREIYSWYPDKAVIEGMISTSDSGFETRLRVTADEGRFLTTVGANVEIAAQIANALGVNPDLVDPDDTPEDPGRQVQKYLDWYHETKMGYEYNQKLKGFAEDYLNTDKAYKYGNLFRNHGLDYTKKPAAAVARSAMMEDLATKYVKEDVEALCFYILKHTKQSNVRYERLREFEDLIERHYGETIRLGALYVGRDTKTFREKMVKDDPTRVRAILTGTQGTPNEDEAAMQKHATGRGIFNANPRTRKTAAPMRTEDYIIAIPQTSIPGNEYDAHKLDQSLIEIGVPFFRGTGRGWKHANIDTLERQDLIEARLKTYGVKPRYDDNGLLVVDNMPIHPTGHAYKSDTDRLTEMVGGEDYKGIEMITLNHNDNTETEVEFMQEQAAKGIRTPGTMLRNFDVHSFDPGERQGEMQIIREGRVLPNMILVTEVNEFLKQFGGYTKAERVIGMNGENGVVHNALVAGDDIGPEGLTFKHQWAAVNAQDEDRASAERDYYQRRSRSDIVGPIEDKRYAGPFTVERGKQLPGEQDSWTKRLEELGLNGLGLDTMEPARYG